jgi:hypothetical protein
MVVLVGADVNLMNAALAGDSALAEVLGHEVARPRAAHRRQGRIGVASR